MRVKVQIIYTNLMRSLGLYGAGCLLVLAFFWGDVTSYGYAKEITMVTAWLTFVMSIVLLFPSLAPRFLRRPNRVLHMLPFVISFCLCGVLLAAMGIVVSITGGLTLTLTSFAPLPVVAIIGMGCVLGVYLCVKKPVYRVRAEDENFIMPRAQLSMQEQVFLSRRERPVAAE